MLHGWGESGNSFYLREGPITFHPAFVMMSGAPQSVFRPESSASTIYCSRGREDDANRHEHNGLFLVIDALRIEPFAAGKVKGTYHSRQRERPGPFFGRAHTTPRTPPPPPPTTHAIGRAVRSLRTSGSEALTTVTGCSCLVSIITAQVTDHAFILLSSAHSAQQFRRMQ